MCRRKGYLHSTGRSVENGSDFKSTCTHLFNGNKKDFRSQFLNLVTGITGINIVSNKKIHTIKRGPEYKLHGTYHIISYLYPLHGSHCKRHTLNL